MHNESKKEKKMEKKRPRKPIVTSEDEMKKRNPQSTLDINRAP
ncbi:MULTISPECIES: hypothetical protein [Clostridium]|uniref:Uncharacterized protein n=1 Tax=Clostridium scatologenes TaxID=1548 RepID=A0A0E3K2K0_CLOSL|nr:MULTISPECIES: hypothetical protein [Clostridium]AKA70624.1 hypothetical protein CSCA_3499 [Clostridium scatologenes]